jgi:2-keto-3-deoxy-6-phosphogluconate aldolase
MAGWKYDRKRVDAAIRKSGVVVVMNKSHIQAPEHFVNTMWEVYQAGYVSECTFRIDPGLLKEGMQELIKRREAAPVDKPFLLGVGSIINPKELEMAIDMGFDMIVAPGNVMGGYGEGVEFVKIAHAANRFCAPAIFSPTEFGYFVERPDGNEPDCLKIFPARSHGPKGLGDLLAPYVRDRHKGRIIMPTGAVDYVTGPDYIKAISKAGYFPALGMSAPLALVADRKAPGDVAVIKEALDTFTVKFGEAKKAAGL